MLIFCLVVACLSWFMYGILKAKTSPISEECMGHEWQPDISVPGLLKCEKCSLTCPRFNRVVFKSNIK